MTMDHSQPAAALYSSSGSKRYDASLLFSLARSSKSTLQYGQVAVKPMSSASNLISCLQAGQAVEGIQVSSALFPVENQVNSLVETLSETASWKDQKTTHYLKTESNQAKFKKEKFMRLGG